MTIRSELRVEAISRRRPQDPLGRLSVGGESRSRIECVKQPMAGGTSTHFDAIAMVPRAEIEAHQERALLEAIPYVYERSPLIKKVWDEAGVHPSHIHSLADYKRLAPFIDKDVIREFRDIYHDPFGGVLCEPVENLSIICSSGGTTGDPTPFADRWGKPSIEYSTVREYWEGGIRPGDFGVVMAVTMRPSPHTIFQDLGVVPIFFDHHPRELQRLVEWVSVFRPTVMYFASSVIIHGLEQLERQGVDIKESFSSFKMVIYGGEPLGPRATGLAERWGLNLHRITALGDIGTGIECSEKDGHHAWEDYALVEVLDPETLEPVPSGGRGELVVSSLKDKIVPFLRFRSGDIVKYTQEKCGCGSTHMRYWPLGRLGDEIKINDRTVLPMDVWPAIENVDETSAAMFQIIRPEREMSALRLRVGYEGAPDLSLLQEKVKASVEQYVGIVPEVELIPMIELTKLGPPHKIPRVAKK